MTTIKLRQGTAAQWTSANPTLAAGEPGLETDTGVLKVGDGATAWSSLSAGIAAAGSQPASAKLPARRAITHIVNFGVAGHGWTANSNAASSNLADTTDFVRGTQAVKLTTKGDGATAAIRNTAISPSINLTGKAIEVSVKVDDWTHCASVVVYLGDTSFTNFRVLNMWTKFSASASGSPVFPADNSEWVTLTADLSSVTSSTGSPAISAVTSAQVGVTDDGTAAITMHANHIGYFTAATSAYPNGLVSFTFDDSYATHYTVARPALDKWGYQGTFYTIVDAIGATGRMTLAQLKAMQDVSGMEIGSHAYTGAAHNATGAYAGLSAAALGIELRGMNKWMLDNGLRGRAHFAYPQGLRTAAAEAQVAAVYASARFTLDAPMETSNPNHPLRLRTFRCNTPKTLVNAKAAVDAAYTNGSWLILTTHDLPASVPSGSGQTEWAAQDFRDLVDYIAGKPMPVHTIGDALASL